MADRQCCQQTDSADVDACVAGSADCGMAQSLVAVQAAARRAGRFSNAEYILPYAVSFALHFDSEIILLSVPSGQEDAISSAHSESIRTYLEHILDVVRAQNIEAQAIVTGSSAASTIIDVCEGEEADLIMMTTHGFSGLTALCWAVWQNG